MSNRIGIALFVYNRPEHTRRLLDSVLAASRAPGFKYYLFSDGPKESDHSDTLKVESVRQLCENYSEELALYRFYSDRNLGLANSIVRGVNEVLKTHEMIIVIEDDLTLNPQFFNFMGEMLEMHEHNERIFQISGYMIPTKLKLPSVGLFRVPGSWGWATWRRAWKYYEHDTAKLLEAIREIGVEKFNVDGAFNHFATLVENHNGERDTWAVRWYASMFINNGLALYPRYSLTENRGFDGSGTNCGGSGQMILSTARKSVSVSRAATLSMSSESRDYCTAFVDFYSQLNRKWTSEGFQRRVLSKIRSVVKKYLNANS